MKPKLRIKLLSPELVPISDRLVDQTLELTTGPKETHQGAFCLETTLVDKNDIKNLITYLNKLTGNLPISQTQKKKYEKATNELQGMVTAEPYVELLETAKSKSKNQVDFIEFLRGYDFRFITFQHVEELAGDKFPIELNPKHEKYQFMVRMLKKAKDPKNDRYDPQLILGIKLTDPHVPQIKVYLYGKFKESFSLDWPNDHKVNFKKTEAMWKFPPYMTLDERKNWRTEHFKLERLPDLKATKFYNRWAPHITMLGKKAGPKI